jgi:hypothetical protein
LEKNEDATFKPQTNKNKKAKAQPTHGDRCLDLYSRVPNGKYAQKTNVTSEEAEYAK